MVPTLENFQELNEPMSDPSAKEYFDLAFNNINSKMAHLERKLDEEQVSRRRHQQRYSEELRAAMITMQMLQTEFANLRREIDSHIHEAGPVRDQVLANTSFRKTVKFAIVGLYTSIVALLTQKWWG